RRARHDTDDAAENLADGPEQKKQPSDERQKEKKDRASERLLRSHIGIARNDPDDRQHDQRRHRAAGEEDGPASPHALHLPRPSKEVQTRLHALTRDWGWAAHRTPSATAVPRPPLRAYVPRTQPSRLPEAETTE